MKKNILLLGALALTLGFASCNDDDNNTSSNNNNNSSTPAASDSTSNKTEVEVNAQDIEYTSENANAWGNYAANTALLLQTDATTLYTKWNEGFAAGFKEHNGTSTSYTSAKSCIEQMIEGCIDIANEVGESKIGEPYNTYKSGDTEAALYSVESWYSWHSRDDYKNNILSIANSILGQRISGAPSKYAYSDSLTAGKLTSNSIMVNCAKNNSLRAKAITVWKDICSAWDAIDAIPQPFRNNINSTQASAAMTACATLVTSLKALETAIDEETTINWDPTVAQFVDGVALPTYKDLVSKNTALYNAVLALQKSPSNAAFETACEAWLAARQPWETSEAFLFGPVSELGLDPNMDSWPLDADGIVNILKTQKWSEMNWSGEYEEVDEENPTDHAKAIEAAQAVRGFHTLEFLLFKNGQPRTVK